MKSILLISALSACSLSFLTAGETLKDDLKKNQTKGSDKPVVPHDVLKKHSIESIKTADEQDELSADVQDLIQEQTDPKVVELLDAAEELMGEATENLEGSKTDGLTIAIETEIIEKIYEAAKQKQKSGGT